MPGDSVFQSYSEMPVLQKSYHLSKCALWGVWEGIFASRVVYFMLNPHSGSSSSNTKRYFFSIGVQYSMIYLTNLQAHHSLLEICLLHTNEYCKIILCIFLNTQSTSLHFQMSTAGPFYMNIFKYDQLCCYISR